MSKDNEKHLLFYKNEQNKNRVETVIYATTNNLRNMVCK